MAGIEREIDGAHHRGNDLGLRRHADQPRRRRIDPIGEIEKLAAAENPLDVGEIDGRDKMFAEPERPRELDQP
jgi:hypothetical protein